MRGDLTSADCASCQTFRDEPPLQTFLFRHFFMKKRKIFSVRRKTRKLSKIRKTYAKNVRLDRYVGRQAGRQAGRLTDRQRGGEGERACIHVHCFCLPGMDYFLKIRTGGQSWSGTDGNVYVKLIGPSGTTRRHLLDTEYHDDFERDSVKTYLIRDSGTGHTVSILLGG